MRTPAQRGFSLIEMIIVIVIVGIVFAIGASILAGGFANYSGSERISSAAWQARVALNRIDRELRMVRSPGDLTVGANALTFTTLRGTSYSYTLSGPLLEQSVNGGTPQVLARDIGQFSVQYWQNDGTTPATAATVRYVGVALTVTGTETQIDYQILMDMRDFPN